MPQEISVESGGRTDRLSALRWDKEDRKGVAWNNLKGNYRQQKEVGGMEYVYF